MQDREEAKSENSTLFGPLELLNLVIESTSEMIWSVDSGTFSLLMYNRSYYNYFLQEYGIHLKNGMRLEDLYLNEETVALWKMFYKKTLSEGSFMTVYQSFPSANRFLLNFNVVRRDGLICGVSVFGKEIISVDMADFGFQEVQTKYRNVFEMTTDVYFRADMQGIVREVSPSVKLLGGYEPGDVAGRPVADFFQGPERKVLFSRIARKGYENNFEVNLSTPAGEAFITLLNVRLDRNSDGIPIGIQGMIHDITQRKREENRLKLLEVAISNITDAVVITEFSPIDLPGPVIVFVNDAYTKMTGYTKEELIGKSPRILQGPKSDRAELNRLRKALENKTSCEIEIINYRKNGEEFWSSVSVSPILGISGNYTHWLAIKRDITAQKKLERKIAKASIAGQEKEKYIIGRELHDNISQILVGSLLTLSMVRELSVKDTNWINKTRTHITNAINEIRKLSHELAPAASFKNESLQDSFETLLSSINAGGTLKISSHFDQLDQKHLRSDIQLTLYRILQEQLQNIIKHADATAIDLSIAIMGESIKMRVYDNGRGFDPKSTTYGIGLSNMRKRAEIFSGSFSVNSSAGKGCELIVEIPL
jgi:PAS domain S-box-containing protein